MTRYQGPFVAKSGFAKGQQFAGRQAYQNARAIDLGFRNYYDQKKFVKAANIKSLYSKTEIRKGDKLSRQEKSDILKGIRKIEQDRKNKTMDNAQYDKFLKEKLLIDDYNDRQTSLEKTR